MDVMTIVAKCHSLQMTPSVLNACALITQAQQTDLLRLGSDHIFYNTEDEKYDHAALKEMVIGFQTNLGLKSEILDPNLLQKLLQKATEVDLVRLPTAQTTLTEECDNNAEQVFTDLMAERYAAAEALLQ